MKNIVIWDFKTKRLLKPRFRIKKKRDKTISRTFIQNNLTQKNDNQSFKIKQIPPVCVFILSLKGVCV
jgi:hypothetical protein